MRVLKAGLAYFLLVFGAGFALAFIRIPFLVPAFGTRLAYHWIVGIRLGRQIAFKACLVVVAALVALPIGLFWSGRESAEWEVLFKLVGFELLAVLPACLLALALVRFHVTRAFDEA